MRISDWSSDVCSSDLLLGSRNVDFLDPILFHRRKRIIKLLEGCQPLLVACTELKSPFGELKASQRKIHDRMTREGHDHFGVAIPGGGFFLLLFVCFIIHIRVPFFRLKSRERSVQSLRSFRSEEHTSELQSLMSHSYAVF